MIRKKRLLFATLFLSMTPIASPADNEWIDITESYLTNPNFDNNSNQGWNFSFQGGTTNTRVECMEFWNNTFDIHQQLKALPKGKYRLSVQSYYRCKDNNPGLREYQQGKENITAYLYADEKSQKLQSVYSFYFTNDVGGTWTDDWTHFYSNSMESARKAFDKGEYWNYMEFSTEGGDATIGIRNEHYFQSNWCIFDNFRLEVWGEVIRVQDIRFDQNEMNLATGETISLKPTVSPENATFKKLAWSSSNQSVASVDDKGKVTTLKAGKVVITAKATDNSGVEAKVTLTIADHPATADNLIINEIMSSNIDMRISPAFNFDGWVELYNPSDETVTLKDLYLSDDVNNLQQWRMSSANDVIPAHGYQLLWFDSNALCPANAPFGLDRDGGVICITDAQGNLIAKQTYPEAMERVAYARTTDGGETWGYTAEPTPLAANHTASFAESQLGKPEVDKASCLFTEPMVVTVTIPEGATLRVTTDGTLPTMTNGMTDKRGVFQVSSTSIYRFRLYKDGWLPSEVVTRSYIYKDKDYQLPVISVVSDPRFLYDDSIGVCVQGVNGRTGNGQRTPCNWNMDWERPVNMSYLTDDGTMALNQDVYLEMAGGWSRAFTPHSFKLKGKKNLGGNKNLNYPFFSAKPFIRNRTLQIRNGGNDNRNRIKDAAIETIIQTSGIDIDLQSYQPVHEFINGQYMGVLNMREPNNKHYVYANYGWDDDEIDQFEMSPDSGYVQKCGTDEAFLRLYELSSKAASSAVYEEIKEMLDIDEYINYMAMEFYLGSTDWPQNNIKGFRHRDNGKFRFVSFDLDFAFNLTNSFQAFDGKKTYTFDEIYDTGTRLTDEIKMVTIFDNLLLNAEFRKQFRDVFCIMGGSVFETNRATAVIDSLFKRVNPMMQLEGISINSATDNMKWSLNGRASQMMKSIRNYQPMQLSNASMPQVRLACNVAGARLSVNDTYIPTNSFDGYLFTPSTISVTTPVGYSFKGWKNRNNGSYYSTKESFSLTATDLDLIAEFEAMSPEDRENKGITPIRINEVSASNDIFVNDYFKKSDWVELYNTTAQDIDIEGMFLSDDADKPYKYMITGNQSGASTIIPANGHLLIWCDKQQPVSQLHASFKIDGDGGYILLSAADKSWTDTFSYPAHDGFTSTGRFPDGADNTYVMNRPTVGTANRMSSYHTAYENSNPMSIGHVTRENAHISMRPQYGRLEIKGEGSIRVALCRLSGQTVMTATVVASDGKAYVSTSSLAAGVYIAKATDSQGNSCICKFAIE